VTGLVAKKMELTMENLVITKPSVSYNFLRFTHIFETNGIDIDMKEKLMEKIRELRCAGQFKVKIYMNNIEYIFYETEDEDEAGTEYAGELHRKIVKAISNLK
jgi:hypothetical protein